MAENLISKLLPHQGCVISWEIRLNNMRVVVDGEVRFESEGDYGIESAPSIGPCFGCTVSVREFSITPLV